MKKTILILIITIVAMFSAFAETDWYVGATVDCNPEDWSSDFGAGVFCSTSSRPINHGSLIYYTNGGVSVQFATYRDGSFNKMNSFALKGSGAVIAGLETGNGGAVDVRGGIGLSTTAACIFSEYASLFVSELGVCLDVESNIRLTDSSFIILGADATVPFMAVYRIGDSSPEVVFADSFNYLLGCRLGFGLRF